MKNSKEYAKKIDKLYSDYDTKDHAVYAWDPVKDKPVKESGEAVVMYSLVLASQQQIIDTVYMIINIIVLLGCALAMAFGAPSIKVWGLFFACFEVGALVAQAGLSYTMNPLSTPQEGLDFFRHQHSRNTRPLPGRIGHPRQRRTLIVPG